MLTAPTSVGAVSFWRNRKTRAAPRRPDILDANQVNKAFYDKMKQHWSEAQIMERSLGAGPAR
jgi:hypothetical protein